MEPEQTLPPLDGNPEQEKDKQQEKEKQIETVLHFIMKLASTLLVLWLIFTFVFGLCQVSGNSNYPALRDGDLILYYRLQQNYEVGDMVKYSYRSVEYIGRIVAQGGDVVDLDEDGQLLVNGNVQQEEIFYPTKALSYEITFPYTVEEDSYFMLCDYRTNGVDCRSFGAIPKSDIMGKIITFLRRREI